MYDKLQSRSTKSICKVCKNLISIMLKCEALEEYCQPYLPYIKNSFPLVYQHHPTTLNDQMLTQLILDPSHPSIQDLLPIDSHTMIEIEKLSRLLCYKLHQARCRILESTT